MICQQHNAVEDVRAMKDVALPAAVGSSSFFYSAADVVAAVSALAVTAVASSGFCFFSAAVAMVEVALAVVSAAAAKKFSSATIKGAVTYQLPLLIHLSRLHPHNTASVPAPTSRKNIPYLPRIWMYHPQSTSSFLP